MLAIFMENLETSENVADVREMSGISVKIREMSDVRKLLRKKSCQGKFAQ